jgi:hypothetical protein
MWVDKLRSTAEYFTAHMSNVMYCLTAHNYVMEI